MITNQRANLRRSADREVTRPADSGRNPITSAISMPQRRDGVGCKWPTGVERTQLQVESGRMLLLIGGGYVVHIEMNTYSNAILTPMLLAILAGTLHRGGGVRPPSRFAPN